MAEEDSKKIQDKWARWLLETRHGGDPEKYKQMVQSLYPVRDKLLEHADVKEGDVVLDTGAGDGLIAFGALDLVGENGKVIFNEISQDLVDHCKSMAKEMGVIERCDFHLGPAENLDGISDTSVDVITVRSVLIYIKDKQIALNNFHRVLKPKGRLSIFEPINRFSNISESRFLGVDVTPVLDLAKKLRAVLDRYQDPENDPMLDFDERDLLSMAESAGFSQVHLEYNAHVVHSSTPIPFDLDAYLKQSPNPKVPTLDETLDEAMSSDEKDRFLGHLRTAIKNEGGTGRMAISYVWAVK